ncbi:Initiation-specific alpha-1,6-mannosyltransferase [Lachnellula suecica]|uniref:Initiation-specific alpha-1,6-mannosyltransferase n=1 Tax=Lachnellula suecica TaxID=602035 RepID=A0A8T9C2A6_9HELO|nr:Initiation-specific alpha-1,6-mannosyltransferase [Lachnellula suecica]
MLGSPKMKRWSYSNKSFLLSAIISIYLIIIFTYRYKTNAPFYQPYVYSIPSPAQSIPEEFAPIEEVFEDANLPMLKTPSPTSSLSSVSSPFSAENWATAVASKPPLPDQIPAKIWQSYGPKGIGDESQEWMKDCLAKNPAYSHEYLTDESAEEYVQQHYASRPDIIHVYTALQIPILRADLLRYLILYEEGGLWLDMDISCEDVPINDWIPGEYKDQTALVVGLEFDGLNWESDGTLHSQVTNWAVMSKPRVSHMIVVIEDCLDSINDLAKEHGVRIEGLTLDMIPQIVDLTGPKRMTWSILKSLGSELAQEIGDKEIGGLLAPKLIGDVLVLPANSWAAVNNNYPKDQGPMLATHHYFGSWTPEDER